MADRPIIFSAPMVRAMLDRRKKQTRRLLTPAPVWEEARSKSHGIVADGWAWKGLSAFREETFGEAAVAYVPYAVGDRLYVREAHALVPATAYRASEGVQQIINPYDRDEACIYALEWERSKPRWRPSIHMPRWASRLWLAVTDVRVQRLQDCSEADAIAEGIEHSSGREDVSPGWRNYSDPRFCYSLPTPRGSYATLWDSLHAAEGTTWDANPWVVAVSFDVHRGNIDAEAVCA